MEALGILYACEQRLRLSKAQGIRRQYRGSVAKEQRPFSGAADYTAGLRDKQRTGRKIPGG